MNDSYWEHDCTRQKEAPQALAEASEDVIEPSREAGKSDDPAHGVLLLNVEFRLSGIAIGVHLGAVSEF